MRFTKNGPLRCDCCHKLLDQKKEGDFATQDRFGETIYFHPGECYRKGYRQYWLFKLRDKIDSFFTISYETQRTYTTIKEVISLALLSIFKRK